MFRVLGTYNFEKTPEKSRLRLTQFLETNKAIILLLQKRVSKKNQKYSNFLMGSNLAMGPKAKHLLRLGHTVTKNIPPIKRFVQNFQ